MLFRVFVFEWWATQKRCYKFHVKTARDSPSETILPDGSMGDFVHMDPKVLIEEMKDHSSTLLLNIKSSLQVQGILIMKTKMSNLNSDSFPAFCLQRKARCVFPCFTWDPQPTFLLITPKKNEVVVLRYFLCTPLFGEDFQFDKYFSNELVQPPTRKRFPNGKKNEGLWLGFGSPHLWTLSWCHLSARTEAA